MTAEKIALKLYVQTLPTPDDLDKDAREGEIQEWESKIQLKVELDRLVDMGPNNWSARWAEEFKARYGFVYFAHRREWAVFNHLLHGDVTLALDEIAGRWRAEGSENDPDKLLG